jgi:hypothetical protein
MYVTRPNIIIGFHGCDEEVRYKIVCGRDKLKHSQNKYDWLGNGAYFWEYNEKRALQYAELIKDHPERCKTKITTPAALGAVIQLGYCLDLLDASNLDLLKIAYEQFMKVQEASGFVLPVNKPIGQEQDLLLRNLDCAVIESLHQFNKETAKREFDSVRGVFLEGGELYPNAGFREKNHIQICIRNPNCIKGYFVPRTKDTSYSPI